MENSRKDSLISKLKDVIDSPEDENETAIAKSESLRKDEQIKMLSNTLQDLYDFKNRFNRMVELNNLNYYAEDIEDRFRECSETVAKYKDENEKLKKRLKEFETDFRDDLTAGQVIINIANDNSRLRASNMELYNKIHVLERFINMDKRRKSVFIKCANSSFTIPHKMLLLLANPDEIRFDDEEKECGDFLDRNLELSKITIAEIEKEFIKDDVEGSE